MALRTASGACQKRSRSCLLCWFGDRWWRAGCRAYAQKPACMRWGNDGFTSLRRTSSSPLPRYRHHFLLAFSVHMSLLDWPVWSITEHRVPELIPVLCSQPAGDVSHKPDGKLPLLSARPAVTPATLKRAATNFAAWWIVPSVLWCCWLGGRKGILSGEVLAWSCLERGADLHMPSWCHCHSLSLASVKSRLVLPFWYWPTRVVLKKGC